MSNIVMYNPNGAVVNMVTNYLQSANTPDYENLPNVLINPDVSALENISINYWKVSSNNVIEMTSDEKTTINNIINAKTFRQQKYRVLSYNTDKKLDRITWYDTDKGDGTYSGIAEQILYTYDDINLIKKVDNTYYYDATIASSVVTEFFNNSQNELIEKNS